MKDYAQAPGAYAFKVMDKANKGTYEHYFPGAGTAITFGAPSGTAGTSPAPAKTGAQ
jgi:hypothetical protein